MNAWLYQMVTDDSWSPEHFRVTVWQGKDITWAHSKVLAAGNRKPTPGDPVIFFFAKKGTKHPGIYGWGVVIKVYAKKEEFTFRAAPPTDLLKMDPLWDNETEGLVDSIRGKVPLGTTWAISPDQYAALALKIRVHASSTRA